MSGASGINTWMPQTTIDEKSYLSEILWISAWTAGHYAVRLGGEGFYKILK
jgi:hypothetical protein